MLNEEGATSEAQLLELMALRAADLPPRKLLRLFLSDEAKPAELPLDLPTDIDCYREMIERALPLAEEELARCRQAGITLLPYFARDYPVAPHALGGARPRVPLSPMERRKPVGQLMFWIDQVQIAQASLSRILGVEEVPDDRTPTGEEPEGTRIVLDDVRFSYREGVEVLHGIDLELVPGERLAVVGPSGSGKSTLGRMLAGINPPTSGSVTVGGVALTDLTEDELRRHVALVTQEHHVFVGTVADNVRLGRPRASADTIRERA